MCKKPRKNHGAWVPWFRLLNKSKKQTLQELLKFLISKGLSDGKATAKAVEMGFVRIYDGKELWNLKKYIHMMQADKKLKKLKLQNKEIHPMVYKRALYDRDEFHDEKNQDASMRARA